MKVVLVCFTSFSLFIQSFPVWACPNKGIPSVSTHIANIEQLEESLYEEGLIESPATYQSNSCYEKLTCSEKLVMAQINGQLKKEKEAGSLTPEKAQEIFAQGISGLPRAGQIRVYNAMAAELYNEVAPTNDLITLKGIEQANESVATLKEEYNEAAKEFLRVNRQMQDDARRSYFQQVKHSANLIWNGMDTELGRAAIAVGEKSKAILKRVDHVLAGMGELTEKQSEAIKASIKLDLDKSSKDLKKELDKTHESIDEARRIALFTAGGVAAVGLGVSGIGLALGGSAFGIIGATGISAVVSTGTSMAVQGAAIGGAVNIIKRGMRAAKRGHEGTSMYCHILEEESQNATLKMTQEMGTAGVLSMAGGLIFGKLLASSNVYARGTGGVLLGGLVINGVRTLPQGYFQKSQYLEELRDELPEENREENLACIDSALDLAQKEVAFDTAAFALELLGPAAYKRFASQTTPKTPPPSSDGGADRLAMAREQLKAQRGKAKAEAVEHPQHDGMAENAAAKNPEKPKLNWWEQQQLNRKIAQQQREQSWENLETFSDEVAGDWIAVREGTLGSHSPNYDSGRWSGYTPRLDIHGERVKFLVNVADESGEVVATVVEGTVTKTMTSMHSHERWNFFPKHGGDSFIIDSNGSRPDRTSSMSFMGNGSPYTINHPQPFRYLRKLLNLGEGEKIVSTSWLFVSRNN